MRENEKGLTNGIRPATDSRASKTSGLTNGNRVDQASKFRAEGGVALRRGSGDSSKWRNVFGWRKWKKYISILSISVQNNFAYFSNLILGTGFFIFILFVMAQLWGAIYKDKTLIEGFRLTQVIWYLIITETIILSRSRFHLEINDFIKSGDLAYQLIRPFSFVGYHLSNSLGEVFPKLTAHLLVGLGLGVVLTGKMELSVYFPLALVTIILGILLNFLLYMAIALTAFWTEDNTAFFFIYSKMIFFLGGMLIPIDFFPGWLAELCRVLPFGFVTYWPARLAVNFQWAVFGQVLLSQAAYIGLGLLLVNWIYRQGVKQINVNGG